MKEQLQRILIIACENIVGFKFLTFLAACIFLAVNKVSPEIWVQVVFTVTGLRAATDIAQIVKPAKEEPDNVDKL